MQLIGFVMPSYISLLNCTTAGCQVKTIDYSATNPQNSISDKRSFRECSKPLGVCFLCTNPSPLCELWLLWESYFWPDSLCCAHDNIHVDFEKDVVGKVEPEAWPWPRQDQWERFQTAPRMQVWKTVMVSGPSWCLKGRLCKTRNKKQWKVTSSSVYKGTENGCYSLFLCSCTCVCVCIWQCVL